MPIYLNRLDWIVHKLKDNARLKCVRINLLHAMLMLRLNICTPPGKCVWQPLHPCIQKNMASLILNMMRNCQEGLLKISSHLLVAS